MGIRITGSAMRAAALAGLIAVATLSHAGRHHQRYVTFLPPLKADSVWEYAATDLVPVIYKVNLYRLFPTPQLDSIARTINLVRADSGMRFRYVYVGGSASPEGPVEWNRKLGHYRSAALERFLKQRTTLAPNELRVENLGEDWASVVRALQKSDFTPPQWLNKQRVLDIITQEPDWAARKRFIRAIDNSRTWQWLLDNVFPPTRNSRLVIVCDDLLDSVAPVRLPLPPAAIFRAGEIRPIAIPAAEAQPGKRLLAVKTNLAFAAALVANIGFEVELWPRWTVDLPVCYSPYDITPKRRLRLLGFQPELRYWLHEAGRGAFFGLHCSVLGFNVSINDHGRYQDPNHALWGLGLGGGWATHFDKARHWGLELNAGLGFARYKYDSYRNWQDGPRFFRSDEKTWLGPTRLGITVSYQWHVDRKTKGGLL